jgi:hypothetical protein
MTPALTPAPPGPWPGRAVSQILAVVDIGTDMGVTEGGEIGRREGRSRGQYCNIHTSTGPLARMANVDAIGILAAKRTTVHQRMYGLLTEPKSEED